MIIDDKIITYNIWDTYNYWMPMRVWETITCYEDYGISIQFNCYKLENKPYVSIVHIEAKEPWTWKFDTILKEFCKKFEKAEKISITNVINEWLIKYLIKHNICITE